MKSQKLNLHDLRVESFVTALEKDDSQTLKGGSGTAAAVTCSLVWGAMAGVAAAVFVYDVSQAANEIEAEEKKDKQENTNKK